jgi:hypothetical protein
MRLNDFLRMRNKISAIFTAGIVQNIHTYDFLERNIEEEKEKQKRGITKKEANP